MNLMLIRNLKRARATKWEFYRMKVGDVVLFSYDEDETKASRSMTACHAVGRRMMMKFKAKKVIKDQVKYAVIERIS